MAKLGFGMLVIMQNEWPKAAEDIQRYREIAAERRAQPRAADHPHQRLGAPRAATEAHERGVQYLGRKWDSIDNHYHFSDGHLGTVKGYESYGKMAKTYAKMKDDSFRDRRRRSSTSASRSSARPTTASSRSPSCGG